VPREKLSCLLRREVRVADELAECLSPHVLPNLKRRLAHVHIG
jgi:hypothetical protein